MVIDDFCVIDENKREVQLLALLLSTVLGLDFNKTEERKRTRPSVIANQVLPPIELSSFPNQGSSCNFLAVNVFSRVYITGSTTSS